MRMFRLAFLVLSLGLVPQAECSPDWPVLKTYEGEYLRKVKMPLGGIGTGTISLSGRGGLVDWEIQNSPAKGFTPNNAYWPPTIWPFFAIRTETAAGAKSARLLEGPLSLDEYEGDMGSRAPNHGFPRFRKAVFKTAYPFAQVSYVDPAVPLEVTLQAMNPLVPGDAEASGIPAILLRWRLKNVTERPIRASVVGMVPNICGLAPGTEGGDDVAPRHASRRNANGLSGVVLAGASAKSAPNKVTHPSDGELALLAPDGVGAITSAIDLRDPGWGVSQDRFWTRFLARGDVGDTTESAKTAYNRKHAAQLCVAVEVPPMATADVPFVLCWRFPNRMKWYWDKANPTIDQRVGNWYATRYASAAEAGERLWRDLPALEAKTLAFVRGVLAASAPDVVKEAALFNLSTLRSETCFRTENGDFFGWEGTTDTYGSCFGSCTHVWGYEHCLVDLWPELARSMLDNQFGPQLDARGHMAFRVGLPVDREARNWKSACADGQMQCIVKAYEYWRKSGNNAWLEKTWPAIRRALSFSWIEGGWDADRDGVMEGCQHNTMDVDYFGPNPQMEFLYLAALEAAEAMSTAVGESAFANEVRSLRKKGSAWTEANLFNGRYYEHEIRPVVGKIAEGLRDGIGARDLSDPDFQLGAGCLIDQLLGDYAARAVGLPPVTDPAHERTTLATILDKCARKPGDETFNPMRSYVLGDERSLKMVWYPEDRFPRSPFSYYRETMTGFEYVVAALLAMNGNHAAAEQVVRDIRDRYDGRKRNPFDEAECGHHYARALAAWTVYKAFCATP